MSGYLDDLAAKIVTKAAELGGITRGSDKPVVTVQFFPDADINEWQAWVPVKPPTEQGFVATAMRPTIQGALQALAREVGAL